MVIKCPYEYLLIKLLFSIFLIISYSLIPLNVNAAITAPVSIPYFDSSFNETFSGTKWYSVDLLAGQGVTISLESTLSQGSLDFGFYDSNEVELTGSNDTQITNGQTGVAEFTVKRTGIYYIKVWQSSAAVGSYAFCVYNAWFNADVVDGDREFKGTQSTAKYIRNTNYTIADNGTATDYGIYYYRFTVNANTLVNVLVTAHLSVGGLDFGIYDEYGELASSSDTSITNGQAGSASFQFVEPGVYYLKVWEASDTSGNYDILITGANADTDTDSDLLFDSAEYIHKTDVNNPDTDGDETSDYTELENGSNPLMDTEYPASAVSGAISMVSAFPIPFFDKQFNVEYPGTGVNWYSFGLTAGEGVTVVLSAHVNKENFQFEIVDADGTRLAFTNETYIGNGETGIASARVVETGTYYVKVWEYGNAVGNYDLGVYKAWYNPGVVDSQRDFIGSYDTAKYITAGNYSANHFFNDKVIDYHRFTVSANTTVEVSLTAHLNKENLQFEIVDGSGYRLAFTNNTYIGNGETGVASATIVEPGTYYVRVWEYGDVIGSYDLTITGANGGLDISYPNGGEVLNKGQDYTIIWDSANISGAIQIDLYKGGTEPEHMLLQLAAAAENDGEYPFNPPDYLAGGADYRIGISAEAGTIWHFSDTFFTIPPFKCIVQRKDSDAEITTSDNITFRIRLENPDIAAVTGMEVVNPIPDGTAFVSATGPHTFSENTVRWDIGTLNPGDVKYVDLTININALPGSQISNIVSINTDNYSTTIEPYIVDITENVVLDIEGTIGETSITTPTMILESFEFGTLQTIPSDAIFDESLPTYVISHGWNTDDDMTAIPEWQAAMAVNIRLKLISSGKDANVLLWNWQEDAVSNRISLHPVQWKLGVPFDKVNDSGKNLALALINKIPPKYNGDIHMIGHSLGSGVIIKASEYLHENYQEYFDNIKNLTLLDSPFHLETVPYELFLYGIRDEVFIDNYFSMLGRPLFFNVDVNVLLIDFDLSCLPDGAFSQHGFSHRWYNSSINNFQTPELLCDTNSPAPSPQIQYGFYWTGRSESEFPFYIHNPVDENWVLHSSEDAINYVEGKLEDASNLIGGKIIDAKGYMKDKKDELIEEAEKAKVKIEVLAVKAYEAAQEASVVVAKESAHLFWSSYYVKGIPYSVLRLFHHSEALMSTEIDIPAEANSLRFSFEFPLTDKGGILEVLINDVLVYSISADDYLKKGWQQSEWIDISILSGQRINFALRLSNSNEDSQGIVSIDDIIIAKIIPSIDTDSDGILDSEDNCPNTANQDQLDSDADGLGNVCDNCVSGPNPSEDADTDDDGIPDGREDANRNNVVDSGETDPCNIDSDNDGIQDGTELGVTTGHATDTALGIFQLDLDPSSTTNPLLADTDGDGFDDGVEDTNHNGRVDAGESDPNDKYSAPIPDGDINGDGILNLTDAILALQITTGINPGQTIYKAADVKGDGKIGVEEAVYILEKVAGMRD